MPGFAEKSGRSSDFQPLTSIEIADVVALLAHWREAGPVQHAGDRSQTLDDSRISKTAVR